MSVHNGKPIGILLFESWHGRRNIGSSRIRGHWLINHWKEAELFQQGAQYDAIIFQKCYWADYAKDFKGVKILDLCVSEDSLIFTDKGWKYANEIKVGDNLLTHKGRFQRVNNVFMRKSKIDKVNASGLCELNATDNHPLWSIERKYNGYGKTEDGDFSFVPIDKLKLFKRHKGGSCISSISKRNFIVNDLNEDMGWFWGYFSAEGSRNKNGVSFAMHKNEIEHRKNIVRIIKKEFNRNGRYYEKDNTGRVFFNSRKLSRHIAENCKSRENKTVVKEIFNASIKSKLKFLEGYVAGDGYCNDYGGICVSTISKKLAYSVIRLFKDCGIVATINYQKRDGVNYCFRHKDGRVYQGKPQWRIQLNPKEAIKFYNLTDIQKYKKCRIDYWRGLKSANAEISKKDNYFLHPVRKIEKGGEIKRVYNFNVGDDHSYIADGVVVKNCDPDWLEAVPIKEMIDACDAVTTSTEALAEEVRKFTNKPVLCIPDRIDLDFHPYMKKHIRKAQWACWFGYSHNAKTLDITISTLTRKKIYLKVISNSRPPYNKADKNVKYDWDNPMFDFNKEVMRCDFVIMPEDTRPTGKFKSNNKTITSWALGMPVAKNPDDVERFLDPEERRKEAEKRIKEVREKWDIRLSIQSYKDLIKKLKDGKV